MAVRWQATGQRAELQVYPQSVHGSYCLPDRHGTAPTIDAQPDLVRRVFRAEAIAVGTSQAIATT